MTTVAKAVDRVLHDYLRVNAGGSRNQLASAVPTTTETELTLSYNLRGLQSGSKLSIGLEDLHVWSVDAVAKTAEVDRGEYGSTAATHASGDTVYVDPDFTPYQIVQALNAGVSQLISEGLFQVTTVDLTMVGGQYGYDLTSSSNVLGPIGAWYSLSSFASTKIMEPWEHYTFVHDAPTAQFPSGTAVQFDSVPDPGATVRVQYRHELSATLSALTDDVETVTGLEADAVPLLCLAAALELVGGREVERNNLSAANNRRSEEVPAGAWTSAPSRLERLYRNKLKAERARLARKYPMRLGMRRPLGAKVH